MTNKPINTKINIVKKKKGGGQPGNANAVTTPLCRENVFELARFGAGTQEIARFFRVGYDLINNKYKEEILAGNADMVKLLRKKQLETALDGNVPMMIHLGKQILGQKDHKDIKIEGNIDNKISVHFVNKESLTQIIEGELDDES